MTRLWISLFLSVLLLTLPISRAAAATWTDTIPISRIHGPYGMPERIHQLASNYELQLELSEAGGIFQNTITYSVTGEAGHIGRFLFELNQLINGR